MRTKSPFCAVDEVLGMNALRLTPAELERLDEIRAALADVPTAARASDRRRAAKRVRESFAAYWLAPVVEDLEAIGEERDTPAIPGL
jgi:hypothetical protein